MADIKLFDNKNVRSSWNDEEEKWYFSIVDVVGVLTDSPNPRNYWKVLKHRLLKEGNESVTKCNQLKFEASDLFKMAGIACQIKLDGFCGFTWRFRRIGMKARKPLWKWVVDNLSTTENEIFCGQSNLLSS